MSAFTKIAVTLLRTVKTMTASRAVVETEQAVAGSPFQARYYRARRTRVERVEDGPGVLTKDEAQVLSFDAGVDVQAGDIAELPGGIRVRITLPRPYSSGIQCDTENVGVEQGG